MEDSLYGFRFRSQTSLLVSDQHEVDNIEMEPMQWQESRQHEARNLHPPHNYCDEATQTPNWDYLAQRGDVPSALTTPRYEANQHQSESTAPITGDAVNAHSDIESTDRRGPCLWHPHGHLYCPIPPTPQPIRPNQQVSDESMQMFPETESEAEDAFLVDLNNWLTAQHSKRESGSDASSVTMEDVRADDEGPKIRSAMRDLITLEDLMSLESESDSDGDETDQGNRERAYEADGEIEDMCE